MSIEILEANNPIVLEKIVCIFLAYRNLDVIQMSLESILVEAITLPKNISLDIVVVENYSENTEHQIKPYLIDQVRNRRISKYISLDENITNNAIEVACENVDLACYDYVIITDGDIFVPQGTVVEQLNILKKCAETFACGLTVDYLAWNTNEIKKGKGQYLQNLRQDWMNLRDDLIYVPIPGGFWFVMFKTEDWQTILRIFSLNGIRILDGVIQKFARSIFKRHWVQSKKSVGRELHRESVALDYDAPLVKNLVMTKLIDDGFAYPDQGQVLYQHNRYSTGMIYDYSGMNAVPSHQVIPVNPIYCVNYKYDPYFSTKFDIVANVAKTTGKLFINRKPPNCIVPGVYLIAFGIGTSFYLEEMNAVFLQMRDGEKHPRKGPFDLPDLKFLQFNHIQIEQAVENIEGCTIELKQASLDQIAERLSSFLTKNSKIEIVDNAGRVKMQTSNSKKIWAINLGSGTQCLKGWDNLDANEHDGVIYWRAPLLPYETESIDFVYSEHMLEYLPYPTGVQLLIEILRVLKIGGVARISCPNLLTLVNDYINKKTDRFGSKWKPASPCILLNEGLTLWGHKFTWDFDEIKRVLALVECHDVYECNYRESKYPELNNLETRSYFGDLIFEIVKTKSYTFSDQKVN